MAQLPPIKPEHILLPERIGGKRSGITQKTHMDLRADPRYQAEAEKFLNYLAEQEGTVEKITGGLISTDIFETLRDEEGRLGTAIDRARVMRDAPEDMQQTYRYLRDEFEASKAGSLNEIGKATWDRGIDMLADPFNLLFAFIAPGVGSAASKAALPSLTKTLTSQAGKQSATKTLRNIAAANSAKAAAFEGSVWTGIENLARQDINISTGAQEAFSQGDFAASVGLGGVFGAGIGYGLGSLFARTPSRLDQSVHDNINTSPKKIDFNDPETPKPSTAQYQAIENIDGEPTVVIYETELNWGPVLDSEGKPKVRPEDGSPVNASTRRDKDGNFIGIDIDDVAIRKSFNDKPWTKGKTFDDGSKLTPLKPNDIRTEEEWIMFNVFHALNHASYPRPNGMSKAIYQNGANVAALRDLKVWRRSGEMPQFSPEAVKIKETLDKTFKKVKLSTNPITGKQYYNRELNPEVDNRLLKILTTGKKSYIDPQGNPATKNIDVNLPEEDAANIILAIKNIVIEKKPGAKTGEIKAVDNIIPEIQKAIQGYGFSANQLKNIVQEVIDAYGPGPQRIVDPKNPNAQNIIMPSLETKQLDILTSQLANDMGGGKHTASILADEINNIVGGQQTPLIVKNNIFNKAADHAWKLSGTILGGFTKATNLLTPARRYAPNVALRMQRLFTSEVGQFWKRGEVQLRDVNEYGAYYAERFGSWTAPWKRAYDGIKATAKGQTKKDIDVLISDAIRKGDSVFENINFATPEARRATLNATKILRKTLKDIAREGKAKGLLEKEVPNYLSRLWNRETIAANREEFKRAVMSSKGVKGITNDEQAEDFLNNLLDIKYQFGSEHSFGGNKFFSNRKIDIADETTFNKFLETDLEVVTTSYFNAAAKGFAKKDILNVRNLEEWNNSWVDALENEMRFNGANSSQIQKARESASYLYQNITGEGMERYGKKRQFLADSYMLANRMAYLPLATLSSITEIFINMSKAGPGTAFRAFRDTVMNGSQKMYYDSMDQLMKVQGMTRAEARYELNQLGIALDQATADTVERLSGDTLSNATMRKWSNGFFRFTLLDQWTKTVQLTSYITGKRLITENIENLANKMPLIKAGKISNRMQRQIDELKELGIEYTEGIKWYNDGAKLDVNFYNKVKRGAGSYTNQVILNPTAQSGLKPTFMSNPKTAVFGQLLGYPAAFTNTILKGVIKQGYTHPETILTHHLPAAAIMTTVAAFTNGIRSDGKAYEDKESFEIAIDGLVRMGANGLIADMFKRGSDAAEYYQDPVAAVTGAGVIPGDVYKLARQGDVLAWLFNKIPGTGARDLVLGLFDENAPDDLKRRVREADKVFGEGVLEFIGAEREPTPRSGSSKGGEVYNVPQVTEEPDERIDRITGLPYDVQAGGAFIDEEDRQGFALGTIVSKAVPVLKSKLSEALGELADKGENIPINRLVKRLQNRGVRKDEIEAAGIDEDGNAWHSPTQESEKAAAQIRTVVTRSGNLAYTPDGLRAIDKARTDKPLIDSNFVTARETLRERYIQDPDEGSWEENQNPVFKELFADIVPPDVNNSTLENIVFRDPRVNQLGAKSRHFRFNLPKDSAAFKAQVERNPYSYHVRFDIAGELDALGMTNYIYTKPRLRVFEMQTDLSVDEKTVSKIRRTIRRKLGDDDLMPILQKEFGIDKKNISFTQEQAKALKDDAAKAVEVEDKVNEVYQIIVESGDYSGNLTLENRSREDLGNLNDMYLLKNFFENEYIEEYVNGLRTYKKTNKDFLKKNPKLNSAINRYIELEDDMREAIRSNDKVQKLVSATTRNIMNSSPIDNLDVSQNIINRMIAETKRKGLPEVSFLIGTSTPKSKEYLKPLQRSEPIQDYYSTVVANQVKKVAKKIGGTTSWDKEGYLTIVLPEKEFTLPMYKNEGGYISRQKYMAGTLARTGANIIKGLWHGSPHSVPTLKASKSIDSNALQLGRGVSATKDKKIAESYLDATPNRSVGLSEKALLEERTARGSSTPTLYELEAHINEDEIIRTGTKFADQPTPMQTKINAIAKDYDIQLSDKDKDSKRIFYILKRKLEAKDLRAEDIFKNYGIKAAKRDLRETSLKGLSKGGDEEYSFYDDSVLEIVSKNIKTGGPENLIQGGTALIKKAKEAGMDTERIVYHATGERWATDGITFDEKYFLDNYMDDISPENHMVYLGTDADISSFYAQKKWNSKAEAADRAAGRKIKKDYWTAPEILPMFLKGPGLKLKIDKWAPSTYKSPDNKAMPWGKWFIQDAMDQLNIKTPVTKKSDMIKEIWKEAKKQGYGYIEFINVEDVSKAAEITPQTQIIPLGPDKVKSIYANYNPDATKEDLMRNLFSATGGSVRKEYKDGGILKGGLGNRIVRSLRFLLNTKDAINYYKEGYRQEAIEAGARAVGVGAREQRLNERDAAKAINNAVGEGRLDPRHTVPVDDYGFTKGNVDELFNAVNHGLLSFRYGTNPAMRGLLQIKEGEKFGQAAENPIDSSVDSFNNSRGFYLEQQGLTESEALQKMIDNKQRTDFKLNAGLPLVRGQDFIFNSEDLKAVGTQETLGPLYTGRIERNKGGKLLGSLHRSNCK